MGIGKVSLGVLYYSLKIDNEVKKIIYISQSHFLETKDLSRLIHEASDLRK